jgi:hypothetical protein
MRSLQLWIAALAIHLLLVLAVSAWDIVDLAARGRTLVPAPIASGARDFAHIMESMSPRQLHRSNLVRQTVIGYVHAAGIESPYSYFAPNVPPTLQVVFEIQHRDHHVSHKVPSARSATDQLRLSALIDRSVGEQGLWREVVLQMLGSSIWEDNPDAVEIRAIVASRTFPGPSEFLQGAQESYDFVCSYNFKFDRAPFENGHP